MGTSRGAQAAASPIAVRAANCTVRRGAAFAPARLSTAPSTDRILAESGMGTFGRVLLCHDRKRDVNVAMKVVRRVHKYTDAARIEGDILSGVNARDPDGRSMCVRLFDRFEFYGHYCMVFEALGPSLYDYLKANKYRPLPLFCVQAFADQLVTAVSFLHGMNLIHTDLKPENVLLVSSKDFVPTPKPTSRRDGRPALAPASTGVKRKCCCAEVAPAALAPTLAPPPSSQ